MNKIILLLCLMIGITFSLDPQSLLSGIKPDSISIICTVVSRNKDATNDFLNKVTSALLKGDADQKFPLAIGYVTSQSDRNQLTAGGTQCKDYFGGLQMAFQSDVKNNVPTTGDTQQTLIQFIKKNFPQFNAILS